MGPEDGLCSWGDGWDVRESSSLLTSSLMAARNCLKRTKRNAPDGVSASVVQAPDVLDTGGLLSKKNSL